jgi:hypothetical protein
MTVHEVPQDPTTPGEWYGLGTRVFDNGASWGHTGHLEQAAAMVLRRSDGITWAITVAGSSPTTEKMRATMDRVVSLIGV